MAGPKYGSSNPFLTESEPSAGSRRNGVEDDYEDFHDEDSRLEQLRAKRRMLEDRQLEATQRSLAVIAETQDIGNATARELLTQGEKLESTERKLDTIEYVTKLTQRHITGIRSVFGSLKNWVRGSKDGAGPPPPPEPARAPSKLASLVDSNATGGGTDVTRSRSMPAGEPAMLRMRLGDDYSYDDDGDGSSSRSGTKGATSTRTTAASFAPSKSSSMTRLGAGSRLDDNLDLMADGVQQLKDLAIGLGDEIEKQNVVIDRISVKADRVDLTLNNQTSQIRKLL